MSLANLQDYQGLSHTHQEFSIDGNDLHRLGSVQSCQIRHEFWARSPSRYRSRLKTGSEKRIKPLLKRVMNPTALADRHNFYHRRFCVHRPYIPVASRSTDRNLLSSSFFLYFCTNDVVPLSISSKRLLVVPFRKMPSDLEVHATPQHRYLDLGWCLDHYLRLFVAKMQVISIVYCCMCYIDRSFCD